MVQRGRELLQEKRLSPQEAARHGLSLNQDGIRRSAFQLLSYPQIGWSEIQRIWPELAAIPARIAERLVNDATYAVYLDRQAADIAAYRRDERIALADGIDFDALPGLSNELRAKLKAVRPQTLGQAARMEGMTPAAITLLAGHARKLLRESEETRLAQSEPLDAAE